MPAPLQTRSHAERRTLPILRAAAVAVAFAAGTVGVPEASAQSQTPMTAEEFDAYVTGRTLTYGIDGRVYGIEQYLSGRRVLWAFVGEECREGVWYPQDEEICFVYDHDPANPQCWVFWQTDRGLMARFTGPGGMTELVEVEQSETPMSCEGPAIGV